VGISNYNAEQARVAIDTLKQLGTPMLIHQPRYNMLNRAPEQGLFDVLREKRVGCIAFAPLQGGILTDRYLNGIPEDSRAAHDPRYLKRTDVTDARVQLARSLHTIAAARGQSVAQLMLVVGSDAGGLYHPNWEENLSLALKLQHQLEAICPGICRYISLRSERFNQDLMPGMVLVEVGAAGNTLDEALAAMEILAQAIENLAKGTVTADSTS